MSRETNDSLWLWILGMTDIIVHQRSGAHSIDQEQNECFNEVQRLNPSFYNKQQDDEEDQEADNQ